jgi:uncharacterized protein with von Willebrand factor type A (vWA) domain
MTEEQEWLPSEKNIEDFELLIDMLNSQRREFDLLSKKKTDGQLNKMKIKMANRVLVPLKEILSHEDSHKFLDTLEEDDVPTNSDVVLIISQYESAIDDFKEKYYKYDKLYGGKRWLTEEYPPNYYDNLDYDEDEDE